MIALFWGADDLRISEAIAECKRGIGEDFADMNITMLDGRKLKANALIGACEAVPFLSDKRLVLVEGAIKNLRSGTVRDEVRAYLSQVPPTTDLIFVEGNDFDKRSALFVYLKKAGDVREFQPRQGAELQRWLAERAKSLDVRLPPDAATQLIEFAGQEGRMLLNELQKLAAYVGPKGTITVEAVRLLVADTGEGSVFEFVDALAARQVDKALRTLHTLLDDGQAAQYLLFMVGRQVRVLLNVGDLASRRMSPDAIAAETGQKPFVVRKALGQINRFDKVSLLQMHDRLVELDHWSKTGRIEPETALGMLVVETCSPQTNMAGSFAAPALEKRW